MSKKRFFLTFSILAVIVWSSSWWLYRIFMYVVHMPGWSEYILIEISTKIYAFSVLIYIIIQVISVKKKGASIFSLIAKFSLTCLGLYLVYILASQKPNAEGFDIIFVFVIAVASGFALKGTFISLSLAWLFIICVNEVIQYALPFRYGNISDIGYNMLGILLGVILSMRWFWKK